MDKPLQSALPLGKNVTLEPVGFAGSAAGVASAPWVEYLFVVVQQPPISAAQVMTISDGLMFVFIRPALLFIADELLCM
jgi:hypothetical protein